MLEYLLGLIFILFVVGIVISSYLGNSHHTYDGSGDSTESIIARTLNDIIDSEKISYIYFRYVTKPSVEEIIVVYNNINDDVININTPFMIASVTKIFTSLGVLIAASEGKLDLNKSISDYLPAFKDESINSVTLIDLINHKSGVNRQETNEFSAIKFNNVDEIIERLRNVPNLVTHAKSKYTYSNINFIILGAILESVAKISWHEYLRQKIFTELGLIKTKFDNKCLENAYVDMSSPRKLELGECDRSYASSAFGLESTVSDLMKFAQGLNSILSKYHIRDKFLSLSFIDKTTDGFNVTHSGYIDGTRSFFKAKYSSECMLTDCLVHFINLTIKPSHIW